MVPVPQHWEQLSLAGQPVGVGWTADDGNTVWRQERYLWAYDGQTFPVRTTLQGELDAEGRVVAVKGWRNDVVETDWSGEPAWWLEMAARREQLPGGRVRAFDPARSEVVDVDVVVGPGRRWSWTLDGIATEVVAGPRGPLVRSGPFAREPVATRPALAAVDPVALVRLPSAPVPDARKKRWARWWVHGEERVVSVPLDLEVPRATLEELRELVAEVQGRLEHAPTPGRVDAVALLGGGRGDCSEHAALFEQLATERGMRVRQVSGVVYTEARGPGLDLHAWVEVEIPKTGWVPVDPALGQAIADATHLKLAQDPDLPASLVQLLSDRAIEVVEVR